MDAVAVIIVAYDSADDLETSLPALRNQLEAGDEVVIVDNASPTAVPDQPGARVVRLDRNLGFAGGVNAGVAQTSAPLIFLLNPDAVVQPGCLAALRDGAARFPGWGAWQALVTLPGGERANTAGNVAHWSGIGWAGRYDEPVATIGPAREVGFASGAALMIRRSAWDQVAGFEARYFMYMEDLDLSLRLRLAGWGVGVVPEAVAEHGYEFAKGDYKWFYLERNRWWTVLCDYPAPLLVLVMPALLALELVLLAVAAQGGWLKAKLRSQAAVALQLPAILRRRRGVQAGSRVGPVAFADGFSATLDSPFLGDVASLGVVALAQRIYWSVVVRVLRWISG